MASQTRPLATMPITTMTSQTTSRTPRITIHGPQHVPHRVRCAAFGGALACSCARCETRCRHYGLHRDDGKVDAGVVTDRRGLNFAATSRTITGAKLHREARVDVGAPMGRGQQVLSSGIRGAVGAMAMSGVRSAHDLARVVGQTPPEAVLYQKAGGRATDCRPARNVRPGRRPKRYPSRPAAVRPILRADSNVNIRENRVTTAARRSPAGWATSGRASCHDRRCRAAPSEISVWMFITATSIRTRRTKAFAVQRI